MATQAPYFLLCQRHEYTHKYITDTGSSTKVHPVLVDEPVSVISFLVFYKSNLLVKKGSTHNVSKNTHAQSDETTDKKLY